MSALGTKTIISTSNSTALESNANQAGLAPERSPVGTQWLLGPGFEGKEVPTRWRGEVIKRYDSWPVFIFPIIRKNICSVGQISD
jgi:hypothetical protein